MALKLEKVLENGVVALYHRITSYSVDFREGLLTVSVASYVSAVQREAEIGEYEKVKELETIREELDALVQNPTDENEKERLVLSEKVNAIFETYGEPEVKPRHVAEVKTEIKISRDEKDYTRDTIYGLLSKKGNLFEGAKKS